MSAGLELVPGSRLRSSLNGDNWAETAVEKRASRRWLCRAILSPLEAQPTVQYFMKSYLNDQNLIWVSFQRKCTGEQSWVFPVRGGGKLTPFSDF